MADLKYSLNTRNATRLLTFMIEELCGNSEIFFEGDCSFLDVRGIRMISRVPSESKIFNAPAPKTGYEVVALPLNKETKGLILQRILPQAGISGRIWHILIKRNGDLEFAAYDSFHEDDVHVGGWITPDQLERLIINKSIWSYQNLAGDKRYPAQDETK